MTYSCKFIQYRSMNSSRLVCSFDYLPSPRSRWPSIQPVLDRCKLTPRRGVILLCWILSIFLSICRFFSWKGISLTTQMSLVSRLMKLPTKKRLLLMSCQNSKSSSGQKLKGLTGSQRPIYMELQSISMKVQVISHKDKSNLTRIKETLMQKWLNSKANTQRNWKHFDDAIDPTSDEFAYAILLSKNDEILLVASLFAEYKLTRNLCTTYHLQIEYKTCDQDQELFFQREVVKLIPGYKITGLKVTQSQIFKPHQVFMDINLFDPHRYGNL